LSPAFRWRTLMAALVGDDDFAYADEALARNLADDFRPVGAGDIPAHVPVSHWWWGSSIRAATADRRQGRSADAAGDVVGEGLGEAAE
jgi:hypothetical protein